MKYFDHGNGCHLLKTVLHGVSIVSFLGSATVSKFMLIFRPDLDVLSDSSVCLGARQSNSLNRQNFRSGCFSNSFQFQNQILRLVCTVP